MTDSLTILTHNKPLTKIWKPDGSIEPSAKAKYFAYNIQEIQNISELSNLLTKMADKNNCSIIRGAYVGDGIAKTIDEKCIDGVVRRTGQMFKDQKLHSVMIEVDDFIPLDACPINEPEVCIQEYISKTLPECFHEASYHWQLSSSAGKVGKENLLKVHIWFWLKTPYSSYELKAWAKETALGCDHSVFNPVQIHFTANPIFEANVADPIKKRCGFIKCASDEVDLVVDNTITAMDLVIKPNKKEILHNAIQNDKVAMSLQENGFVKTVTQDGRLNIACPFKDGHSVESTETSTVYYPQNTNGYKNGHFYCHHQSCAKRTDKDFLEKIGIKIDNILNPQDQSGIAERIIADVFSINSAPSLIRNDESWYQYDGKCYSERKDEGIRAEVRKYLDISKKYTKEDIPQPFFPTLTHVNGVLDALKSRQLLESKSPPVWINKYEDEDCLNFIPLNSGILHVPTRELLPHSSDYFSLNVLPYDYKEEGTPDGFINFLSQIYEGDHESIDTTQEMIGYFLTNDTSMQKMFMLVGPTRSGKSTLSYIIANILGPLNIANPKLSDFGERFGLQPLINKLLAIVPDARIDTRSNIKAVIEMLLCISGEDTISFDRKNKSFWQGTLKTRILLVSNESPQLTDASNALVNRFIYLNTKKSFLGNEDVGLKQKLLAEMPQIFTWALEGRDRLLERKKFVQPKSSVHLLEEFKKLSNPIQTFIDERCELIPNGRVAKDNLYAAYTDWSNESGYRHYKSKETFGRDLMSAERSITIGRYTEDAGNRRYYYNGINLLPTTDPFDYDDQPFIKFENN